MHIMQQQTLVFSSTAYDFPDVQNIFLYFTIFPADQIAFLHSCYIVNGNFLLITSFIFRQHKYIDQLATDTFLKCRMNEVWNSFNRRFVSNFSFFNFDG